MFRAKFYTNAEQSNRLLQSGLWPETADFNSGPIPRWSHGALLHLLPDHPLFKFMTISRDKQYINGKQFPKVTYGFWCHNHETPEFTGINDMECLVDMFCWFLDNGYLKKTR